MLAIKIISVFIIWICITIVFYGVVEIMEERRKCKYCGSREKIQEGYKGRTRCKQCNK